MLRVEVSLITFILLFAAERVGRPLFQEAIEVVSVSFLEIVIEEEISQIIVAVVQKDTDFGVFDPAVEARHFTLLRGVLYNVIVIELADNTKPDIVELPPFPVTPLITLGRKHAVFEVSHRACFPAKLPEWQYIRTRVYTQSAQRCAQFLNCAIHASLLFQLMCAQEWQEWED